MRKLLIISSDRVFASLVDRQLGEAFEVHAAATEPAAFALLEAYAYAGVVIDLCSHPVAISVNAVTAPVIALVPAGAETPLPPNALACKKDEEYIDRIVEAVKTTAR